MIMFFLVCHDAEMTFFINVCVQKQLALLFGHAAEHLGLSLCISSSTSSHHWLMHSLNVLPVKCLLCICECVCVCMCMFVFICVFKNGWSHITGAGHHSAYQSSTVCSSSQTDTSAHLSTTGSSPRKPYLLPPILESLSCVTIPLAPPSSH